MDRDIMLNSHANSFIQVHKSKDELCLKYQGINPCIFYIYIENKFPICRGDCTLL